MPRTAATIPMAESTRPQQKRILDQRQIGRVIRRMAGEIVEQNQGVEDLMLVGIRTRGVPLARALAEQIRQMEDVELPLGTLDITLYRDDLSAIGPQAVVKRTELPRRIDDQVVVLCDDVLYTGRTVRAALDALVDYGRPRAVRLAVLVDRGHRELPIHADVVGKKVATSEVDHVQVTFQATDEREEVVLLPGARGR